MPCYPFTVIAGQTELPDRDPYRLIRHSRIPYADARSTTRALLSEMCMSYDYLCHLCPSAASAFLDACTNWTPAYWNCSLRLGTLCPTPVTL